MYYIKSYYEATSVKDACLKLQENENAMIIAGGTDVLIKMRDLKEGYTNKDLIGINTINELKQISIDNDGTIKIGALASFSSIEKNEIILKHIPILASAVAMVGGPQIRNTGTIGGNICNGATSADSASSLFALNAKLEITDLNSSKIVDIKDFYISAGKVALKQGEMLTKIIIEEKYYKDYKGKYFKFAQRKAMDIATIGVAVLLKENDRKITDLKISLGVAAPTPIRAFIAEEFAKGKELNLENIKAISQEVLKDSKARTSWRASKEFRENLIKVLSEKALIELSGVEYEN